MWCVLLAPMTNPKNTNYMRSVNDYSLSAHEIFNEATLNRFPCDTRVYTVKHVTPENYKEVTDIVKNQFLADGFDMVRTYTINYDDGSLPGEESQYTIYEQNFYLLQKKRTVPKWGLLLNRFKANLYSEYDVNSTVVLEMYRRNNELVVLTLSPASTSSYLQSASKIFKGMLKPKPKDKTFYTIGQSSQGFELEEMKIPTVYNEDFIKLHYNDDFYPVHETVLSFIDNDRKGLILLHGKPGAGKTSYIEQLISKGGVRKIVYIPPHLAGSIASPQFVTFVRDKLKGCVLIIEDAEAILTERGGSGADDHAVANLLNISDGILGKALNILVIATFNRDKQFIDKALMRKGRMVAEYYFDALQLDKAKALVKIIHGEDAELNLGPGEEATLGNVFNMDFVQHRTKEAPKVAFGFQASK